MTYVRYGTLVAKPGQRDAAIALLTGMQMPGELLGCLSYDVGVSEEQPDTIFTVEKWVSQEAHALSLKQPAVIMTIMKAMPLMTGELSGTGFEVVGTPLAPA